MNDGKRDYSRKFRDRSIKIRETNSYRFLGNMVWTMHASGPAVEELAEEGYAVGKVDVDQNMALAQQFRVVSIPTLILFKDGAEAQRFVGLTSKEELKSALEG